MRNLSIWRFLVLISFIIIIVCGIKGCKQTTETYNESYQKALQESTLENGNYILIDKEYVTRDYYRVGHSESLRLVLETEDGTRRNFSIFSIAENYDFFKLLVIGDNFSYKDGNLELIE